MARNQTKRRDANHAELVAYAKATGFSVLDLSQVGGGLDLLVGLYGIDQRVEIKDGAKLPSARLLTDGEREVFQAWKGRRPTLWESEADVDVTRAAMLAEASKRGGW